MRLAGRKKYVARGGTLKECLSVCFLSTKKWRTVSAIYSCSWYILSSVHGSSNRGPKSLSPSSFQVVLSGIFVTATWKQPIYQCSHIQNKISNDTYTYLIRHSLFYTIHTCMWVTALEFEKQCTHLLKLIFKNLMFSSREVRVKEDLPPYVEALGAKGLWGLAVILRLSPTSPTVFPGLRGSQLLFCSHLPFKISVPLVFQQEIYVPGIGTVFDDEVAQEVKVPASKPDNLSSVSETNTVEEENWFPWVFIWPWYTCLGTHMPIHMYTCT